MKKIDFYKVLNIDQSATTRDVKTAYYKLAMKYHPDRNPNNKAAEEKFKQIVEAYQVLSDPQKRFQYHNPHYVRNDARTASARAQEIKLNFLNLLSRVDIRMSIIFMIFQHFVRVYPKLFVPFFIVILLLPCYKEISFFFQEGNSFYERLKNGITNVVKIVLTLLVVCCIIGGMLWLVCMAVRYSNIYLAGIFLGADSFDYAQYLKQQAF